MELCSNTFKKRGIKTLYKDFLLRLLYSFLLYLLVPFILLRLLWRARKAPPYKKRWAERFGFFKMDKKYQGGIWVHVVSVGEVLAAAPLVQALHRDYPHLPLIVTTMTPTGSERVLANLPKNVFHVYAPYDLPGAVKRFLKKTKPRLAIFMETELWPNILHYCRQTKVPTLLANARLSAKSAHGYQHFQPITHQMLQCLSIIAAQAQADANRFAELGANETQIKITGNMKFDMQVPASLQESADMLRHQLGSSRAILIAASTHEGEDEIILDAFKIIRQTISNCLLIIVPRHPERFEKVAQLCKKQGFEIVRRSEGIVCTPETDIFFGDTMGELRLFLGASDVAFIGGSLIQRGGHNMLEAAAFSIPVLSGPHIFNFAETGRLLNEANALITVNNAEEFAQQVVRLFQDSALRQEIGERGHQVVLANRGALQAHLDLVKQLLSHD